MYHTILHNHPGVFNEEDVNFCDNLQKFYKEVKEKIRTQVRTDLDFQKVVTEFTNSFDDVHLSVQWKVEKLKKKPLCQDVKKFSLSQCWEEVAWMTVPTFDLDADREKEFNQFVENICTLRSVKYLVFDLRGNQGGNSEYASKIIDTLFGKEYSYMQRCLHNKDMYVDWRASEDNVSYISSLLLKYPDNCWIKNLEYGLRQSLEKGKKFYREYSFEGSEFQKEAIVSPMEDTKIIVIIDSKNVSAALDCIDKLKMMTKKLILIGQKTKADRLYMEVRSLSLPSGKGKFFFPIKVYRNRIRLDNEPYVPDITFDDLDNTSLLKNFIVKNIVEKNICSKLF